MISEENFLSVITVSAFSAIIEAHIYHFLCSVRDRLLAMGKKIKEKTGNIYCDAMEKKLKIQSKYSLQFIF